jgi:sugar O-acyltransferase (sialic acid O-acetyltransferase NeuD family)
MKDIIIVGAGGFGREAVDLISAINKVEPIWNIKGFIDDNLNALEKARFPYSVIGSIKGWQPASDETFVIGIASPKVKEAVVTMLKERGAVFATLIHPFANVSEWARIGEGCVVNGHASIGDGAVIGNYVHIAGSMIGQDSIIGDFSTTTGYTNIASARLGKRVMAGSHAVVLHGIKVGDDAIIGAGSVVVKNVKAGTTVFGNPAKKIELY